MGIQKREQVVEARDDPCEELDDTGDMGVPENLLRVIMFLESQYAGRVVEVEDESFEGGRMYFDFTSSHMQIIDCGVVGGTE
jgi:hypothetical protein